MKSKAKAPIVGRHSNGDPLRMGNAIHVANPGDKHYMVNRYLFEFGAIGPMYVLAYGDCLSDALEIAAEFLLDNELWGLITPHGSEEDLCLEDGVDPFECGDLTYTESGWLTSYEWAIHPEGSRITNDTLQKIHHDQ